MILPLGHDGAVVRRWPWITLGLILVNVLVFVLGTLRAAPADRAVAQQAREAVAYWRQNGDLETPEELQPYLPEQAPRTLPASVKLQTDAWGHPVPPSPQSLADHEERQQRLQALTDELLRLRTLTFSWRYGYIPGSGHLLGLVTYQFLHGGWLHLIFNLWFLWLTGCNIEDLWGRITYPLFYIVAGIVAALAHGATVHGPALPLIGASGAIAGTMGAFLMRKATVRIRFAYLLFIRAGTFRAPAYVMLPLWLGMQLLEGTLSLGRGDGVAYWAHIGGFGFGALFALVMMWLKAEHQLSQKLENQSVSHGDPEMIAIGELIDSGEHEAALARLQAHQSRRPDDPFVFTETIRAATGAGNSLRLSQGYVALLALQLKTADELGAVNSFHELCKHELSERIPPRLALRLAKRLAKFGLYQEELSLLEQALSGLSGSDAWQARFAMAEALRHLERSAEARALLDELEPQLALNPAFEGVFQQLRRQLVS